MRGIVHIINMLFYGAMTFVMAGLIGSFVEWKDMMSISEWGMAGRGITLMCSIVVMWLYVHFIWRDE